MVPDTNFAHTEEMKYSRRVWARIIGRCPVTKFRNIGKSKDEDERRMKDQARSRILNEKIRTEVKASLNGNLTDVVDGWWMPNLHSSFKMKGK